MCRGNSLAPVAKQTPRSMCPRIVAGPKSVFKLPGGDFFGFSLFLRKAHGRLSVGLEGAKLQAGHAIERLSRAVQPGPDGSGEPSDLELRPAHVDEEVRQPGLGPRVPNRVARRQYRQSQKKIRNAPAPAARRQPVGGRQDGQQPQRRHPEDPPQAARHAAVIAVDRRDDEQIKADTNGRYRRDQKRQFAELIIAPQPSAMTPGMARIQTGVIENIP